MIDLIRQVFGEGQELQPWQMAARAAAVFLLMLVLIST